MKNISVNSGLTSMGGSGGSIYAGGLLLGNSGLKSTQEKMERQQKAAGELEFWEKQKESLKDRKCETVEEIARKLESLHTYEDQVKAVKMAYNHEQMMHALDEAEEIGEKIAESVEKMEPKTPEERRKEAIEEAAGTEEESGMLSEVLDELDEIVEELEEEVEEELAEQTEEIAEELQEVSLEEPVEEIPGNLDMTQLEEQKMAQALAERKKEEEEALKRMSFDIRI